MPKYISKINKGGNDILIKDSEARSSLNSKVDVVQNAVSSNIALLRASGNIKDSGKKLSDYVETTTFETTVSNIDNNNNNSAAIGMIMYLANRSSSVSDFISIENPEWSFVMTDNQNKVICDIRKNGSAYICAINGIAATMSVIVSLSI